MSPRERAAGRAGPETDNLGDGAKRELLGQTGTPTLGEQRGETQEHILQVIHIPLLVTAALSLRADISLEPHCPLVARLAHCSTENGFHSRFRFASQGPELTQNCKRLQGSGETTDIHGCSGKA